MCPRLRIEVAPTVLTMFMIHTHRGVDRYGTEGTCPPIFMKGERNPPNILEVMSFRLGVFYPVTATTVVCCILMQILYVVSRNKIQLMGDPDPLPGLRPWTPLGDFRPIDPQSSFMSLQ